MIRMILSLLVALSSYVWSACDRDEAIEFANKPRLYYAVARLRDGRLSYLTRNGTWRQNRREARLFVEVAAADSNRFGSEFVIVVYDTSKWR